ncbi:MAG: proton-conducting transporter membrane subunit [Rhodococcus sp. (in: high G+C Gram-positive bacteria)]|uniref:proton-conducting transporter transmembrane domain-containing protein n=1 Tax=Rhodococcus sp. TaxID=1831 RepID=UPI003BAE4336
MLGGYDAVALEWSAPDSVVPALLALPIIAPLLVAVAAALAGWRRSIGWVTVWASVIIGLDGVATSLATVDGSVLTAGPLRADALSAVMLLVVGVVAVVATWAGVYHVDAEVRAGRTTPAQTRTFGVGVSVFLAASSVAVSAGSLAMLWIAVEAMTVATAALIGSAGTRAAWEAKWKFVVITSVGLAMAGLGTVLVYVAAGNGAASEHRSSDWAYLAEHADLLDPGVLRIAFPLLLIGFGTAAGLVPLHSWLPDAHGQAPAPVSALMSGCLLAVAVYALLRCHRVVTVGLGEGFVRALLLAVALASLAVAVSMLIVQRDYMRLLAYSSMQYMAVAVFGLAIGTPIAVAAVLLHLLGHGLGKAVLFCGAGQISACEGSTEFDGLRGMLTRHPAAAGVSVLALAALLGFPPFSPFASMHTLVNAGMGSGLVAATAVAAAAVIVLFIVIAARVTPMFFSSASPVAGAPAVTADRLQTVPLVLGLTGLALLGIFVFPLHDLLTTAGAIVVAR